MNADDFRAMLDNGSARPWHMNIKDRMSSAVAVIWTPVEGAGGVAIMCSQPARYRKHGDHEVVIAAVNAAPAFADLWSAAKVVIAGHRRPQAVPPSEWYAALEAMAAAIDKLEKP